MDEPSASVLDLGLEGEIRSYTLPSLLFGVTQTRETGVLKFEQLTLSQKMTVKTIYIQEGRAVFATSTDREDRLGQVLLRRGVVSLERILTGIERSLAEKKRLGTVLVEEGWIRPIDLVAGVTDQVSEIIYSLFQWTEGVFSFALGDLPTREIITLQMSTPNLILEGIRRVQSWYRIREAIGGLDTRYQTSPGLKELTSEMKLSLEEWTLLSLCDEPISLREVCARSPLKDFDICRLLWAFLAAGVLRKID
jgi:hypothetical protein